MIIDKIEVGQLQTNCYILKKGDKCVIIDPGAEAKKIIARVGKLHVLTILVTHFHFDHIEALDELINYYSVKLNDYSKLNNLKVIATPGHTKDSQTFYFFDEQVMFCGDFLFKSTFGRIDLGGNRHDMMESIIKISNYDDNITLYPGHGPSSTLAEEKLNFKNYLDYLKSIDKF